MRTPFTKYAAPVLAFGLLAGFAVGCGKKDKGDDNNATAPALDTWVTDSSLEGGSLKIKYKSNDANAKFQCALEAEGEKAEWQDCPTDGLTLAVQPGVRYTFRVKAVGNGGEDAEPYAYTFVGGGSTSTNGPTLTTLILNKSEVNGTYANADLTLQLGVDGASTEDVRYECKRENETAFRRCPDGDQYKFLSMQDGYSYSLAVRAVPRDGGAAAAEDSVAFRVELTKINVVGIESLQAKRGMAQLQFSLPGAARFGCAIDQSQPTDCTQGLQLRLESLQQGSHTLNVSALGSDNAVIASEQISFCAMACPGTGGGPVQQMNPAFLLGSHYTTIVPQGMHVQQYSSSLNTNAALNFYRISVDSDPYAIGIDRCAGEWSMITSAMSPSGNVYDYCRSNNPQVVQNFLLERRFADNHLQIATDPELVGQPQGPAGITQEVILYNMFTRYEESFVTQSRFATLCQFGIDGFSGHSAIRRSDYPIAMANGFFAAEWKRAEFWTCDVMLSGTGPNDWGQPQVWKIGAFYIADRNQPLPDLSCGSCGYNGSPNLLEVVYMARGNLGVDAIFAQAAQQLFLETTGLRSARP